MKIWLLEEKWQDKWIPATSRHNSNGLSLSEQEAKNRLAQLRYNEKQEFRIRTGFISWDTAA